MSSIPSTNSRVSIDNVAALCGVQITFLHLHMVDSHSRLRQNPHPPNPPYHTVSKTRYPLYPNHSWPTSTLTLSTITFKPNTLFSIGTLSNLGTRTGNRYALIGRLSVVDKEPTMPGG